MWCGSSSLNRAMALRIFPYYEPGCPISPDFLWGSMGTDELHAVLLKENRTRCTGWGCVQEIRVSRSFFARCGIPLHSDWYPSRFKRGDQRSPPTSREKRARYGAPEFVAGKTRDPCYGAPFPQTTPQGPPLPLHIHQLSASERDDVIPTIHIKHFAANPRSQIRSEKQRRIPHFRRLHVALQGRARSMHLEHFR